MSPPSTDHRDYTARPERTDAHRDYGQQPSEPRFHDASVFHELTLGLGTPGLTRRPDGTAAWWDEPPVATPPTLVAAPGPPARMPAANATTVLPFVQRYEPLDLLGAGSYAEVFLARDRATGADVALKILHDRVSDSAIWPARERYEREVALMQTLAHDGIVPVLDHGYLADPLLSNKQRPALVMPLVTGETLATVIGERRAWTESRVLAFLRQTLPVLVHLEAHDVVHRDLGPQNIFVTTAPDGTDTFRISDFGLARDVDTAVVTRISGTLTDAMAGRAIYTDAANRGGLVTSSSDLISLARIALALLRGGHSTESARIPPGRPPSPTRAPRRRQRCRGGRHLPLTTGPRRSRGATAPALAYMPQRRERPVA